MVEADEKLVRQYLLGELDEAEMSRFEERLMTEGDLFEMLEMVEDDLFDERLDDRLSSDERDRFDTYFLSTPARRERLELEQSLRAYTRRKVDSKEPAQDSTDSTSNNPARTATPENAPDAAVIPFPPAKQETRAARRPTRWYLGLAAAAIVVVAIGLVAWRIFFPPSDVSKGLQALNQAYREQRPLEARITGFDYAPRTVTRGGETDKIDQSERDRAELILRDAFKRRRDAETYHAIGLVYLVKRDWDKAIENFKQALTLDEQRAKLHSDLGAAYLERAVAGRDQPDIGDLANGLEQLNRAIELDQSLLAAHFNKALCLQRMNALILAREAWEDYLKRDKDSEWAREAERNLRLLESQGISPKTSEEVYQDFLTAYQRQDKSEAWRILSQTREMITGTMLPFQLTRRLMAATIADAVEARETVLGALRFAGQLEAEQAGDPFFAELAKFYASAGRKQVAVLGQAEDALQQGYQLCLQGHYSAAGRLFREAQSLFQRTGNVWEMRVADYWLAYTLSQQGELKKSSDLLGTVVGSCVASNYRWLNAQAESWLANNSGLHGEYSEEVEHNKKALNIAARVSDLYSVQKVSSQMGEAYKFLGQLRRALEFNQMSLPATGQYFTSYRQFWRSLNSMTDTLFALHLFAAAEAYEQEALRLALNQFHDPVLIHNSYFRLAQIYAGQQAYTAALLSLKSSLETIATIENDPATKKLYGLSLLQTAQVKRQMGDGAAALDYYQRAAKQFDTSEYGLYNYSTHKGMLLCDLLNRDDASVEKELPVALGLFEQNRRQIREEQNRNHFFDTEQNVYDLAIDYEHNRGSDEQGFNYAEFSRARSLLDAIVGGAAAGDDLAALDIAVSASSQPLTLNQLQQRLPDNLRLVEYAVLQNGLLIWVVSKTAFRTIEQPVPASALEAAANEYLRVLPLGDGESIEREKQLAAQLHDWLFAPLEDYLGPTEEVAIVADKFLFKIPFVALLSRQTGRRIVNDYTLLYAPSASILVFCSDIARTKAHDRGSERLLSIGDPAFNRQQHPTLGDLPWAAFEANQVARFYQPRMVLTRQTALKERIAPELKEAEVIHFAAHYLPDEFSPMKSRLLLAAAREGVADSDYLSLQEIQIMRLPKGKVAILSACQSGIERYFSGEGLIGLSRAFVMAGIPLVVASQWAVESDATAELMINFHRLRKTQPLSTAAALRQAQVSMLNHTDERYRRPYYWAAFFPIGGHASF